MLPIELKGTDVRFLVSSTTGLKVPVIAARGLVFSAWAPSPEELKQLNEGVPVWLVQRGVAVPEMTMIVAERRQVIPTDLAKEAQNTKLDEKVQMLARENDKLDRMAYWVSLGILTALVFVIGACIYLGFRLYSIPR